MAFFFYEVSVEILDSRKVISTYTNKNTADSFGYWHFRSIINKKPFIFRTNVSTKYWLKDYPLIVEIRRRKVELFI